MGLDLVHVLSPKRHYCEFICGRCKRLTSLDSYVTSTCAHPICKSCCNKKMPKNCPRCNKPVGELKCLKASQPLAHKVLSRIKVACPMRHRSSHQGCKWVGSYDEIQAHLDSKHLRCQPRRQSKKKHELEESVAASVVEDITDYPVIVLKKEGSKETITTLPRSNCTNTRLDSCYNEPHNKISDKTITGVMDTECIKAKDVSEKRNEILVITVDSLETIDTDDMGLDEVYNKASNHKKGAEIHKEFSPPIIEIPTLIMEQNVDTFDSKQQVLHDFGESSCQDITGTTEEIIDQQQKHPTECSFQDSCADLGKAVEECIVPMEIVVANDKPDSWAINSAAIIPEEPSPPASLRRRSSHSRRRRRRTSSSSIVSQEQQSESEIDDNVETSDHRASGSTHRPPITRKIDLQRSVMDTSDSEDKDGSSSSNRSLLSCHSRSRRNSYQEHSESENSHDNDDREQQQQQQHQNPRSSKRKRRRSKRVIEISEPVEDMEEIVANNNTFISENNNETNDLDVASTWKEEGIRAFNDGNYKEAGEFLTCAINSLPNSSREPKLVSMLLSNRAESFLKMDLFSRCLEDAEEALDLNNQNVKAYLVKSTAQTDLACFGEACKTLALGCLNTDSPDISEQLKTTRELSRCIREIRSLENENRHSDILRVIQTSNLSHHKQISQARAAALVDLEKYDEAITETNELIENDGNNAIAFFIRARAKFFNALVSESLADCQSAMTTNDYNDTMQELDDFGDLVNCVEHSFQFAEEAMKNKDYEQACNFYDLAFDSIQQNIVLPKSSELYRVLHMGSAEANYKVGNTEKALMHSNLVVESSQHSSSNSNGNGSSNDNKDSSMEDQNPSILQHYSPELVCTGNPRAA